MHNVDPDAQELVKRLFWRQSYWLLECLVLGYPLLSEDLVKIAKLSHDLFLFPQAE